MTPKSKIISGAVVASAVALATAFIMPFEGRKLTAYSDVNGVPTICDGITHGVKLGQTLTDTECNELLKNELGEDVAFINKTVKVPLNVWQEAALSSFVYNVGEGNFLRSSVLRQFNSGNSVAACNDIAQWVYVGGRDCRLPENNCRGIVIRRSAERKLCLRQS